ncbi:MAG: peptidase caspase catalytic subunit p20 [Acidobacteria bacterium]|nr:peptidase caspase catalytic subunit p20 [Acidobacteriota bacterium]
MKSRLTFLSVIPVLVLLAFVPLARSAAPGIMSFQTIPVLSGTVDSLAPDLSSLVITVYEGDRERVGKALIVSLDGHTTYRRLTLINQDAPKKTPTSVRNAHAPSIMGLDFQGAGQKEVPSSVGEIRIGMKLTVSGSVSVSNGRAVMNGATVTLLPTTEAIPTATPTTRASVPIWVKTEEGKNIEFYDHSYALVVGVKDYPKGWPTLQGAEDDAYLVCQTLFNQGFAVTPLISPSRATFDKSIREFMARYGHSKNNRLVIYFAGHGETRRTEDGRELAYIVPSDAPLPSKDLEGFMSTAINLRQIETYAEEIEAKHVLFVFDSCFSGSLFESVMRSGPPPAILDKTAMPVREFISAGSADQQVPDKSIFCTQFVEGINGAADSNRDGYVTGSELGEFLHDTVTNYSRRTQTPRFGKMRDPMLDKGDVVFVVPPKTR